MFNLRLKQLREDAGYSQYSFAAAFGTKQSTVGGWESGAREPKIETLIKLAKFFNVSLDYLLGSVLTQKEKGIYSMLNLKQLRLDRKLTQAALANALDVAQTTISSWERGEKSPDPDTLVRLANFYNVSVDYLLGRENKKEAPLPVPMLGKDAQKLLDMYGELDKENKDQVMRYVTSLYYVDRANKSAQYSGALAAYEGGTQQHTVSKETAEKVLRRLDDMEKNT